MKQKFLYHLKNLTQSKTLLSVVVVILTAQLGLAQTT